MSDIITNTTNTNESKVFNVYVSKSTTAGTALVTRGSLNKTDTAPTAQGLYILSDVGTYTNLGGIVTTSGKLNYAYFDGTTWKLIAVDLPNIPDVTSNSLTLTDFQKYNSVKNTGLMRIINQKFYFDNGGFCKFLNFNGKPHFFVYNLFYQNEERTVNLAAEPSFFRYDLDYAVIYAYLAVDVIAINNHSTAESMEVYQSDNSFAMGKSVILVTYSNGEFSSNIPCIQTSLSESPQNKIIPDYSEKYDFSFGLNSDFEHNFTSLTEVSEGLKIVGESNKEIWHKKKSNSKEHNFSATFKIVSDCYVFLKAKTALSSDVYGVYNSNTGLLQIMFLSYVVNTNFVSNVNDWIKLSLKFYYDSYILEVENITQGKKTSTKMTLNVTDTMGGLLPISTQASLFVDTGTIILKEFTQSDLLEKRPIETLFLGDSITSLYYVGNRANSYQFKTYSGKEMRMASIGFPGGTTGNLLTHIKDIIAINPKYCVCYLGTNDVLQGISLEIFEKNYSDLLLEIVNAGIQPIIVMMPPINNAIPTTYNNIIIKLVKKYLCHLVDLSAVSFSSSDFVDGVHPNSGGATKIANKIKEVFNEIN